MGVAHSRCLDCRIDSKYSEEYLVSEIAAWELRRNTLHARTKRMFKTEKARTKSGARLPESQ